MRYYLGIDIGTSGTKTIVVDEEGRITGSAMREYPLSQPQPGWAEQDPEDWWQATKETIADTVSTIDPASVQGIGLSGQMHGLVLLDERGQVLRPSIIWCDQRTGEQVETIRTDFGEERLKRISGNPPVSGFTLAKLLWVKEQEPEIYAKIAHILLPKDYIRYRLTGDFATEVSDASGMQLIDIEKRDWSPEICRAFDIEESWLPWLYESQEVTGHVSDDLATAWGLGRTAVVGGAGDQAAGAVGNGIVEEGVVSVTLGTSGVVFTTTDGIKQDPEGRMHSFCHALPGKWHNMGVTQGAGLSLSWYRDQFGGCLRDLDPERDPYDLMMSLAQEAEPGSDGLLYLPYMMGERTPHLDPDARAVFFGLSARHTQKEIIRSLVEGVTYSLKDSLELFSDMDIRPTKVRVSGGGAKSPFWRQLLADAFGLSVVQTNSEEGPAYGVAILAMVGTGLYERVEDACDALIRETTQVEPEEANRPVYERYYQVYCSLYPALKERYQMLKKARSND